MNRKDHKKGKNRVKMFLFLERGGRVHLYTLVRRISQGGQTVSPFQPRIWLCTAEE